MSALWARSTSLPRKIWIALLSPSKPVRSTTRNSTCKDGNVGFGLLDLDDDGYGTASGKYMGNSTVRAPSSLVLMEASNPSFSIKRRSRYDLNDPVHTAAYRRASCLKLVFIQHRTMAGAGPRSIRPGAMLGASGGERFESPKPYVAVSKLKLLARPEAIDRNECAELARPSDLCDELRSVIWNPPRPLLVLDSRSTEGRDEWEKWF